MTEYYKPPTDGRDIVSEIQGWMHVLCFHYVQNRREVREYDAARKEAKQFQAELAAANARADAATQAERERCAKIVDMECNIQKSLVDDSDDDWKKKACKHAAVIAEIIGERIRAGGQP